MTLFMRRFLALGLLFAVFACAPLLAPFSEPAYEHATSLKARSLAMVALSGDDFAAHDDEARALLVDVDAAYEYAKGIPKNQLSTSAWNEMRDPSGGLLGEFVGKWQRSGQQNAAFRAAKSEQIAQGFDVIICLEVYKRAPQTCDSAEGQ